jgi:hypothetical protein
MLLRAYNALSQGHRPVCEADCLHQVGTAAHVLNECPIAEYNWLGIP